MEKRELSTRSRAFPLIACRSRRTAPTLKDVLTVQEISNLLHRPDCTLFSFVTCSKEIQACGCGRDTTTNLKGLQKSRMVRAVSNASAHPYDPSMPAIKLAASISARILLPTTPFSTISMIQLLYPVSPTSTVKDKVSLLLSIHMYDALLEQRALSWSYLA